MGGGGGLLNLETSMVSVLHKELEKWKTSSTIRLDFMRPGIRMKSELPVGK